MGFFLMRWRWQKAWPLMLMELVIGVSTIIHGMLICLWRSMGLQIEEECVQLNFLESNHLEIVLVKRLLQTGRQLSLKFLISTIVAHLESDQEEVWLDLLTFWSNWLEWIQITVQRKKKMQKRWKDWRSGQSISILERRQWLKNQYTKFINFT